MSPAPHEPPSSTLLDKAENSIGLSEADIDLTLATSLASVSFGAIVVDDARRIVRINTAACEILQRPAEQLLGQSAMTLVPDPVQVEQLHLYLDNPTSMITLHHLLPDGQKRVISTGGVRVNRDGRSMIVMFLRDITEQHNEAQRSRSMAAALDRSDSAILTGARDLSIAYANEGFTRLFGYRREELIGQHPLDVLGGTDTDPATMDFIRSEAGAGRPFHADVLLYRRDGQPLWVSISSNPVVMGESQLFQFVSVMTDITLTKMHEVLHDHVLDAIVREQPLAQVTTAICQELERIAPTLRASVLSIDNDSRLRPLAAPSLPQDYNDEINGLQIGPHVGACGAAAWRGRSVSVADIANDPLFKELPSIASVHGLRACWSAPIKSSGGRVLGTFAFYYGEPREPEAWHVRLAEVCLHLCSLALEREQTRLRMHQLAFYDSLTGMPNRMMFSARTEQLLVNAEQRNDSLAVLFLDVDRFKRVNETQGHAAGDGLLRDISERMNQCLSPSDLVGRQSGDEFVLALPHCTAEQAGGIAERLLNAIAAPSIVGSMTLHPSASIGVAMFPDDGRDIDTLLRNADLAMRRTKSEGGGSFRFFSADMNRLAQERVALETALRDATRREQLTLHYQPQVECNAPHALCGVEALLRWEHPQLGMISPARFIPIAEECGLISEISYWVMHQACHQIKRWRERNVPIPRVSVNLSAINFEHPELPAEIERLLTEHAIPTSSLVLEMTESVMLSAKPRVLENIAKIQEMGISLSLDDFGTGYSSLSHLHRLPIDEIKLDMSFVRDLEYSQSAKTLTKSILSIGDSLGMRVVAEGVENENQQALLEELGCHVLQGFMFSRALPPAELEQWLQQHASLAEA